jgi:integrase
VALPKVYEETGKCNANSASVSINKWLKNDFDGLTAHCLRYTMSDRLRTVECPMDMIDQIGGWRSVATIGVGYGKGYSLEAIRAVMVKL